MTGFSLHTQLAADTEWVETLALCRVLLMNDATYPWLILVPERADIREIHELSDEDQQTLMREMTAVARIMELAFDANKMNVAALGNMVPQLHIHIIARYEGDPAWPGPIWGKTPAIPYEADVKRARIEHLREHLRIVSR